MTTNQVTMAQLLSEHTTLSFLLYSQYFELFHRQLRTEHSLGDGLYCTDLEGHEITEEQCKQLTDVLMKICENDTPIETPHMRRDQLAEIFSAYGLHDKVGILKSFLPETIECIKYRNFVDYVTEPPSTDKTRLKLFEIRKYRQGLVIRYPTLSDPDHISPWMDPMVLQNMFAEYSEWAKLIGVDSVSSLNEAIYNHHINDVKWVAEGLHEQKLAYIASELVANAATKRVVTIAGPSSSNKTTFALRLAIALRVHGFRSLVIEMDDYYKNNADIPFEPDGTQDFEVVTALNTQLLGERVEQLLEGKKIPKRKFDFKKGVGFDDENEMLELPEKSFLIMEGIHGLNPVILDAIGRDRVEPIYVSCLTPVNIDCNHRFPTTDLRLIRRMVRDFNFRGRSPRKTLAMWTTVRKGEEKNIFPYQENARLFFNSALVYELPVLSTFAKALLAEASMPEPDEDPDSPQAAMLTKQALRLQRLLSFVYPVTVDIVPHISCIREFVGGSDLKY